MQSRLDPKPIQPLNLLTGVRELLTDQKKWTKGKYARNVYDERVIPNSDEAVCFCIQGAAMRTVGSSNPYDMSGELALLVLNQEFTAYPPARFSPGAPSLWRWNDHETTTHADILKFLDTRIEAHLKLQQPS